MLEGDINQDGELNVMDIVIIINFILELSNLTNEQYWIADMNNDSIVNIIDIIQIVNVIIEA